MNAARFTTITGDDWKRELPKARVRRKGAPARMAKAIRLATTAGKSQEQLPAR